jgi:hypothetical protein
LDEVEVVEVVEVVNTVNVSSGVSQKSDSKEGVAARRSHKSVLAREEIDCA